MSKVNNRLQRKARIRRKLSGTAVRPRLTVYKSLKHIYAQVIDDETGRTLVSASTVAKDIRASKEGDKTAQAKQIGKLVAERCLAAQLEGVVFDRNGFPYHGRVAAVADGAREGGLKL